MSYATLADNLMFLSESDSFSPRARRALKYASTAIIELLERAESAEARVKKAEYERDCYKIFFYDVNTKNNCNNCEETGCQYRPRLGETVRFNCPLWRGKKEE